MTAPRRKRKHLPAAVEPAATPVPAPPRSAQDIDNAIVEQMSAGHPIYGAFAHAFEQSGGVDALTEWAEAEPAKFYAIFSRMVPKEDTTNQINIQINAQLAPTPLDE